MAVELATGYVSLTVSAKGIGRAIAAELGAPLERATKAAGSEAAGDFADEFAKKAKPRAKKSAQDVGEAIAAGTVAGASSADAADRIADTLKVPDSAASRSGTGAGRVLAAAFARAAKAGAGTAAGDFVDEFKRRAKPLAGRAGDDIGDDIARGAIAGAASAAPGAKLADQLEPPAGRVREFGRKAGGVFGDAYRRAVENVRGLLPEGAVNGATGDADEAGGAAGRSFIDGFKAKAAALAIGAGAVAGALLAKGAVDAFEREKAADRLAAQLGLTEGRSEEIGKAAGRLFADAYGESIGDVNQAVRAAFQGGLLPEDATDQQIRSIGAKIIDLGSTFEQDYARVVNAASNLVRNGLAPNSEAALDIVTRGFQTGADKAGDFADTLNEYGTQFRQFGLDGAAAVGLLTQGLSAGARDSDKVADAIKEFAVRAVDGSDLTAESFDRLGFNVSEIVAQIAAGGPGAAAGLDAVLDKLRQVEDPAERSQIAVGLFGTQAEDLGRALLALDPTTAADSLGTVAGAAERLGETLNSNTATKIESFKRKALGKLADFAANVVIPAIEKLAPVFERVFGFLDRNRNTILVFAVAIGGALVAAFVSWAVAAGTAAAATIAAAAPVLAIGAAIALLAAGLIYAYRNSETFRNVVDTIGRFLRDEVLPVVVDVATWVGRNLVENLQVAWEAFQSFLEFVRPVAEWLAERLVESAKTGWEALQRFAGIVKDVATTAWNVATDVRRAFEDVLGFVAGLPARIEAAASGMWDGIKEAFRAAINFVIDGWNNLQLALPEVDTKIPGIGKVGGWALDTPNIPRLAGGGVVNSTTLALLGETPSARPEIVSPEGLLRDIFRSELDAGRPVVQNVTVNAPSGAGRFWWEELQEEMRWQSAQARQLTSRGVS